MTTFGYMAEAVRAANNPYFMHEVLPYWVMLALSPLVAWGVCKLFEGRR